MPGIDDKIVVRFRSDLPLTKIGEVINRNVHLLRSTRSPNINFHKEGSWITITLWLERPDTLNEEEVHGYIFPAYDFGDELKIPIGPDGSVEVSITPFRNVA